MSGIYDVTIAQNASAQIQVVGTRIKITSAPQGMVRARLGGGESFNLLEGQGVRTPDAQPFSNVTITNLGTAPQTVLVFVGDDNFEDTRITGTVSIVDSEKTKVLANTVFAGGLSIAGGTSNPVAQLWNPVSSGKNVICYKVRLGAALADTYSMGITTAGLTLVGQFSSLQSGGADSTAQRCSDNTGIALTGAKGLGGDFIAASGNIEFVFSRPIVLKPGYGLYTTLNTVAGQTNRSTFYFEEVTQ